MFLWPRWWQWQRNLLVNLSGPVSNLTHSLLCKKIKKVVWVSPFIKTFQPFLIVEIGLVLEKAEPNLFFWKQAVAKFGMIDDFCWSWSWKKNISSTQLKKLMFYFFSILFKLSIFPDSVNLWPLGFSNTVLMAKFFSASSTSSLFYF